MGSPPPSKKRMSVVFALLALISVSRAAETHKGPTKDKDEKNKHDTMVLCMCCGDNIKSDHLGIRCIQDHHICPSCSSTFVDHVMSEPTAQIPVKCSDPSCLQEVPSLVFERHLTDDQARQYLAHLAAHKEGGLGLIQPGDHLRFCQFCPFFCIQPDDEGTMLYECWACDKLHCIFCKEEVDRPEDDADGAQFERHLRCAELAAGKRIFEQTLEAGNVVPCPSCGLKGMKDGACTHMDCVKCRTEWCYVCGRSRESMHGTRYMDGEELHGSTSNLYRHNRDWEHNHNRCPMYLDNIEDVDDSWPSNPDRCVEKFHRIRTIAMLKHACESNGVDIAALFEQFNSIRNCGYTLDEIQAADGVLFGQHIVRIPGRHAEADASDIRIHLGEWREGDDGEYCMLSHEEGGDFACTHGETPDSELEEHRHVIRRPHWSCCGNTDRDAQGCHIEQQAQ